MALRERPAAAPIFDPKLQNSPMVPFHPTPVQSGPRLSSFARFVCLALALSAALVAAPPETPPAFEWATAAGVLKNDKTSPVNSRIRSNWAARNCTAAAAPTFMSPSSMAKARSGGSHRQVATRGTMPTRWFATGRGISSSAGPSAVQRNLMVSVSPPPAAMIYTPPS